MEPITPTQWIAQCAVRLHKRWRTVEPTQLQDVAVGLWQDEKLRSLPPSKAAQMWLTPIPNLPDWLVV